MQLILLNVYWVGASALLLLLLATWCIAVNRFRNEDIYADGEGRGEIDHRQSTNMEEKSSYYEENYEDDYSIEEENSEYEQVAEET